MKKKLKELNKKVSSVFKKKQDAVAKVHGSKVMQWILFILLVILTTALISYRGGKIPSVIEVGDIAPYDIKADRDYGIVDNEATAKFRAEALKNIKMTYTFDPYLGVGISDRLKAAFVEMKRLLDSYRPEEDQGKKISIKDFSPEQLTSLKETWEDMLGVSIKDKEWKFLIDSDFSPDVFEKVSDAIIGIMMNPIVSERESMLSEGEKGIAVRVMPPAGESEKPEEENWDEEKIKSALTSEEMKKDVIKGKYIPETLNIDQYEDRMAINIASSLIQPNMTFDTQETENRRQTTLKDIKNVVINVQAGESIIRGGSRFEPWHIKVLEGIKKEKSERSLPMEMVGTFILIFTIYLVVFLFGRRYIHRFAKSKIDLVFMGSLMLLMLLILRIAMFLTSAIFDAAALDLPRTALAYAIPMAAGAMLVRFIINSETAALFAVVLAAFAGITLQGNVYFPAFTLMSSFVAAVSISHVDKRSSIFQAGITTGLINAILVLSIHLINAASVVEPLSLNNIMWYEISAFINGLGCSVFVLVIAPVAESIFGYTTDIKLLELANLNHPLLRELIIRAPGTYHHSHLVGILAESAAEAVGANPLLARVGAYYHDIGKMKKPQYFTENMPEESSMHDHLSPHMSALIIGAHVKEGLELAKDYKLPKVIADMIPQHHGTKKISFFFQKAKDSTDPTLQKIEERDFVYPGPKPQSREAAILMLADGSEAAVRALKEKTPMRIQQVIESLINKSFAEAQLNECELTLRDLNEIGKAFTRILTSIYHQRIEYPKEAMEKDRDEISVFEEGEADEVGNSNSSPKKEGSKE